MAPAALTLEQARRAMIAAQGLASPVATIADALHQFGPVRTLGGVEAYLALRARVKGLRAEDVHAAVSAGDALVMQAMRGCMYLVGREQVPLLRWLAGWLNKPRLAREREKAGIRPGELEKLGDRVIEALRTEGPLTTDGLKKALPKDAVRPLGEAGKKVGFNSTLTPALRLLEWDARLTRRPERDRLDNERYLWRATPGWKPIEGEPAELLPKIGEVFFRGAGLSTAEEFAGWAGIGLREARAAVGQLGLEPVEVEGLGRRFGKGELPSGGTTPVVLLGFEDNLLAFQGGPAILVDAGHHEVKVPAWGSGEDGRLGDTRHLLQRPIIAGGRMVGFWEFDPDEREVQWGCFDDTVDGTTRDRIGARAKDLTKFLADGVGHGRSYSLDTDEALRERSAWVRSLDAGATKRGKKKAKAAEKKAAKSKGKPQRTA